MNAVGNDGWVINQLRPTLGVKYRSCGHIIQPAGMMQQAYDVYVRRG